MKFFYTFILIFGATIYSQPLKLRSQAFADGMEIPQIYTCEGKGNSPALSWNNVKNVTTYALICDDPDTPGGTYVHWIVFNMPPTMTGLPEGATPNAMAALEGKNSKGEDGYTPPCPPAGPPHHYRFTLYALNSKLDLPQGATYQQVKDAISGHIIEQNTLVGTYQSNMVKTPAGSRTLPAPTVTPSVAAPE